MKTILVPLDFSGASAGILQTAASLAQALQARLVLLHVLQPIVAAGDPLLDAAQIAATQVASDQRARTELGRAREEFRREGLTVEEELHDGAAAATILERARALPAELIVMGSHGHTALYDLLLGSTSHAVVKNSPCPVVIVPSRL
ncbi:MAG TPA: universal stress protein [Opitutaceae bacterium]|nr:universal stress protein [Opitutaceae bacterium]